MKIRAQILVRKVLEAERLLRHIGFCITSGIIDVVANRRKAERLLRLEMGQFNSIFILNRSQIDGKPKGF